MSKVKELEGELREIFPKADIQRGTDRVSIAKDTFYTCDRQELIKLEKKYVAGLWCDVRNGQVHYLFHSLGAEWWK